MTEARPALRALAQSLGIELEYESALDGHFVPTSDATCEALCRAMGFAADSEATAARSLERFEARESPPPRAPGHCVDPKVKLAGRRLFGLSANLYSVRTADDRGFGHLGVLRELVQRAGKRGAAFVGLNPLHAGDNRPGRFCPYDPVSRIFRNPLYLDVSEIPELASCPEARERLASSPLRERIELLQGSPRLDPAGVEAVLFALLPALHSTFRAAQGPAADARRRAYARFQADQGEPLSDFATFLALADHFEPRTGGRDWREWPADHRDPASSAVKRFRNAHSDAIDLHAWVQFELDRQLAEAAAAAREAGLSVGLYTDLALGSSAAGSDAWSWPGLFATGVSVGAPPDAFSRDGQDWSFPPLAPHALQADGYRYWRAVLDANLRHAGALRLDHALGLRRLFWIPPGGTPQEGAYVRYPVQDLISVVADASQRHDALIIAEDLGTVPPGFSEEIRSFGMLSSRVLLFERDWAGFRPADTYPEACLASANTHDLPPLAALFGDDDLTLRRRVGQIPDDETLAGVREERQAERHALQERLVRDGFLPPLEGPAGTEELAAAVAAFLCSTPATLVGISLDDLAGETEPINLPGIRADRHPSWTRRMGAPLAAIFEGSCAKQTFSRIPEPRRAPGAATR